MLAFLCLKEVLMRRFILFLIRTKLGLKKYQHFKFDNQRSKVNVYYFTSNKVMKIEGCEVKESSVSVNWLLNENCKITKFNMGEL